MEDDLQLQLPCPLIKPSVILYGMDGDIIEGGFQVRSYIYSVLGTRMLKVGPPANPAAHTDPECETLYIMDLQRSDGQAESITMKETEAVRLLTNLIYSLANGGNAVGEALKKFGQENFGSEPEKR